MSTLKLKLPPFDGHDLGAEITCLPRILSRKLHGFLLRAVGDNGQGANPNFKDFVTQVRLLQDRKQKILMKPALQAKLDSMLAAHDNDLDGQFFYLPLTRPGIADSPWGTGDIEELAIVADIVAAAPNGQSLAKIEGWGIFSPLVAPQPRGSVFVQTVVRANPSATGWNEIPDVPTPDIVAAVRAILDHDAVREVEIKVGEVTVLQDERASAYESIRRNPLYKLPANPDFFPVILDTLGSPRDYIPLVETVGGKEVRRPLSIRYYWDAAVAAQVAPFDILLEGVERGAQEAVAAKSA